MPAHFSRSIAALAVILTAVAGYVDAIGYLNLGHIYVANMSGNSIAIGIHTAHAEKWQVWKFGWPVISFTVGLLLSRILLTFGMNLHWRSLAAPAIALETIALAGFIAVPSGAGGVFLAASAMGIQAATLSRFNGVTVYTCFVTGSLVKFAENAAEFLIGLVRPATRDQSNLSRAVWFAGAWAAYVIGAILGTTALEHSANISVSFAIAALTGLAVMDLIWPAQLDKEVHDPDR